MTNEKVARQLFKNTKYLRREMGTDIAWRDIEDVPSDRAVSFFSMLNPFV